MILFLDYDGVLHPDDAYLVKGRPVLESEGELFMWSPLLIEALEPYPNVKIVLSTSWARVFGFDEACAFLPDALRHRVIGETGYKLSYQSKYRQISNYLGSINSPKEWLALEDKTDDWYAGHLDNLVLTNGATGLSDPDVMNLLKNKLTDYDFIS